MLANAALGLAVACASGEGDDETAAPDSGGAAHQGGARSIGGDSGQAAGATGGHPGLGGATAGPGSGGNGVGMGGGTTATGGTGAPSGGRDGGLGGSATATGGSSVGTTGGADQAGGVGGSIGGAATGGVGANAGGSGTITGGSMGAGGFRPSVGGSAGAGGFDPGLGGFGPSTGGSDESVGGSEGSTGGSAGASGDSSGGTAGAPRDLCDVGVWDGSAPQPLELSGNTFAHDPTIVQAGGTFYRFWTGDRIPSATSTDLAHWRDAPAVFPSGYPSWVDPWLAGIPGETFNFPWAPDASYFNERFHIYSSFSAKFGDNVSCITHLTTEGPTPGPWTDHGPVICTEGNEPYNAIDADVGLDSEGNPYLAFGSFWDGIMVIPLNADGSRRGNEIVRLAWAREIEAPVLFRRCGYYYLFVTWGLCCPGEGRSVADLSYRVAVGRAESILGPYVDRGGRPMLDGGGTLIVEGDGVQWAAAGHSDVIVAGSRIYNLYHAYRQSNGQAQLRIVELPFDDEGWPVPGGP